MSILLQIGVPTQVLRQMDICAYHLAHPDLSQFSVAMAMRTNKPMVQRAYRLLEHLSDTGSNF